MKKYGQDDALLLQNLRNEEAYLMQEMQSLMGQGAKTAAEHQTIESRLVLVRAKITELDLKKVQE